MGDSELLPAVDDMTFARLRQLAADSVLASIVERLREEMAEARDVVAGFQSSI